MTIADYQQELTAADSAVRRICARWRGYRAFWTLVLMALLTPWVFPTRGVTRGSLTDFLPVALGATAVCVLAAISPPLAGLTAALGITGTFCAILIHGWNEHHPQQLPAPRQWLWRTPQINISSTDVAGNIGGLIFVIGTVLILVLGLPSILWFLVAGTLAGCVLAGALVEWRARHPHGDLLTKRFLLR
ncbi:MAG: hypothetical protein AB7O32_04955 [Vicinamibacterales bacterium]